MLIKENGAIAAKTIEVLVHLSDRHTIEEEYMRAGTVKWFHGPKGYGFIRPTDGSDDVFVFYPSIEGEGHKMLSSGQSVNFESSHNANGYHATRVVLV